MSDERSRPDWTGHVHGVTRAVLDACRAGDTRRAKLALIGAVRIDESPKLFAAVMVGSAAIVADGLREDQIAAIAEQKGVQPEDIVCVGELMELTDENGAPVAEERLAENTPEALAARLLVHALRKDYAGAYTALAAPCGRCGAASHTSGADTPPACRRHYAEFVTCYLANLAMLARRIGEKTWEELLGEHFGTTTRGKQQWKLN